MVPLGRSSHPPISGAPISLGASVPTFTSSLPTVKPTSSSYQTGTKFHSSHTSVVTGEVQYNSSHSKGQENDAPTLDTGVQFPRHRMHRRTKDQESLSKANSSPLPSVRESTPASNNNTQCNRGVQFDLEASAFPPLPGLDADLAKSHNASVETVGADCTQSQNRLSDVVKGTAKLKNVKEKDPPGSSQQYQQPTSNSSRSASPGSSAGGHTGSLEAPAGSGSASTTPVASTNTSSNASASNNDSTDIALSTITLTPPSSPDK